MFYVIFNNVWQILIVWLFMSINVKTKEKLEIKAERRILKARPANPRTYIYRYYPYYNTDPKEGL